MLNVTWVQSLYEVGEGDGQFAACIQLNDVVDPTEAEVWVSINSMDGAVAEGKLAQ